MRGNSLPGVGSPAAVVTGTKTPGPSLAPQLPPGRETWSAWLRRTGPTVLVFLGLGAVAFWGHHSGWKLPKFSDLFAGGAEVKDDWCKEHSVPESNCVECNDKLLARAPFQWCDKHGVHDCPFEHPERSQLKEPPAITQDMLDRAQRALTLKDRPENNKTCKKIHRRIQFASQEVLDKMGVDYVTSAWEAPVEETITASGQIVFEQPRVAPLSSPVAGRVWHVTAQGQLGAAVQRGDLLALVDAAEVGKAKAEFLQAFAQVELRNRTLATAKPAVDQGALPYARLQELEAAAQEAHIRLLGAQHALVNLGLPVQLDQVKGMTPEGVNKYIQFFGIPATIAGRLDAKTTSGNLFPILASRDGVVTTAQVVPGEVVDPTKTLFVVTDSSRMWVLLNVRNEDVKYLRIRNPATKVPGQTVRFLADGLDQEVTGELVWKSPQTDERTRSVQFRAELPNPDGTLLANTFGHGRIVLRQEPKAVVVPNEALHWEGDCNVVFVRDKNFQEEGAAKVFHVRTVRPGVKTAAYTEIIAGLLPGEIIATKNSAVLRGELLKNSLGAG